MQNKKTFAEQLHALFHKKGSVQTRARIQPIREWVTCLAISVSFAFILFGYAGIEFNNQLNDRDLPVLSDEQVVQYKNNDVEQIIRYYEGRTRAFETLRTSGTHQVEVAEATPL
jgi:hypothetical protein